MKNTQFDVHVRKKTDTLLVAGNGLTIQSCIIGKSHAEDQGNEERFVVRHV